MIGSLGDIVFEGVLTPEKESFKRKKEFKYATINNLLKPKLQRLGDSLEEVEFEIKLVRYGDFSPEDWLKKLHNEAKKDKPLPLIIGNYVKGKFVITSVEETLKATDSKGNIVAIYVKVKLKEYN